MKLGKGFRTLYKENQKIYDKFQKDLFKAQNQLANAKTYEEAQKALTMCIGSINMLEGIELRLREMVNAAENTFAKDFPDIYDE